MVNAYQGTLRDKITTTDYYIFDNIKVEQVILC